MWEIPVHTARDAEGLNQQVGISGLKAPERNIPTSPHLGPSWAPRPGVGGIISWSGATIPLLTACIPDAILVATASWPGNLIRGTKLRRQEVQPCPGLR